MVMLQIYDTIASTYVTEIWKITHMGTCETIRISEFGGLTLKIFEFSCNLRHCEWLETINNNIFRTLGVKCTHMGGFPNFSHIIYYLSGM